MPNVTLIDRLSAINEGVAVKAACYCATTAAITLSGLQVIDGVAVSEGARVLVKDQADPIDNGIYNASSGAWTRAGDCDGERDLVEGTRVFIFAGTVSGRTEYICTATADPIVVGESELIFEQFCCVAV